MSYVGPATGIFRALDLAVNEYQGGQDYLAAWDPSTGRSESVVAFGRTAETRPRPDRPAFPDNEHRHPTTYDSPVNFSPSTLAQRVKPVMDALQRLESRVPAP